MTAAEVKSEWHGDTPVGSIHGEVDAAIAAAVASVLTR